MDVGQKTATKPRKPLEILLVMIEPPLPFGTADGRWFNVLLKGLVERGHRVRAFATCGRLDDLPKVKTLFSAPEYDLRVYPHPIRTGLKRKIETLRRPFSYMFGSEFEEDLRREMQAGFDILHLEQTWAGWMGLEHCDRALLNVYHSKRMDLCGSEPAKLSERLRHRLMFRTERKMFRSFRHIRVCSERLVEPVLTDNPKADISVFPIAFDSGLYEYIPDGKRSNDPIITLIGSMGWYPSYSAAVRLLTRIWPGVRARVPNARLRIVGWSARELLRGYLGAPGVEIIENVAEIQPYFEQSSLMVYAPARGTGMKIKILEAMAFGLPVVTTSEGVEGLPARDGVHAGICDDDEGLIERAVALLGSTNAQNRQRHAARELIVDHCSPARALDELESIYSRILEGVQ